MWPACAPPRRRDGDHYVVNGSKTYITNGVRADFVVLAVKTNPEAGHKGLSLLVVEKGTPGFSVGRKLKKLGWRASDTGELFFEDCRVPAANLIGGVEGQGFYQIMGNFQWERLSLALGALGAMEEMLEVAMAHVRDRRAFGHALHEFQVVRHKIAELATELEAARQLTYHALRLHVGGRVRRCPDVHGQEGGHRDGLPGGRCVPPAPRRRRLHDGVRHPAPLARRAPGPHRRGDQ